MIDELNPWIGKRVVLDTAGEILYLGTLQAVSPGGLHLEQVDVHDCRDGHASKEVYLIEAARQGVAPNRARVFVLTHTVTSVSPLDDVIVNWPDRPDGRQEQA